MAAQVVSPSHLQCGSSGFGGRSQQSLRLLLCQKWLQVLPCHVARAFAAGQLQDVLASLLPLHNTFESCVLPSSFAAGNSSVLTISWTPFFYAASDSSACAFGKQHICACPIDIILEKNFEHVPFVMLRGQAWLTLKAGVE